MISENILCKIKILVVLLSLLSCSTPNKDWSKMTTKDIVKSLSYQKVNIPADLLIVKDKELGCFDSIDLSESKLKIFSLKLHNFKYKNSLKTTLQASYRF